jgi:hypothetical protein
MVTVASDAVGTEGNDDIRSKSRDCFGDGADGGFVVDQIALTVGVAEQSDVVDAEFAKAGAQLALTARRDVGRVVVGRIGGAPSRRGWQSAR